MNLSRFLTRHSVTYLKQGRQNTIINQLLSTYRKCFDIYMIKNESKNWLKTNHKQKGMLQKATKSYKSILQKTSHQSLSPQPFVVVLYVTLTMTDNGMLRT